LDVRNRSAKRQAVEHFSCRPNYYPARKDCQAFLRGKTSFVRTGKSLTKCAMSRPRLIALLLALITLLAYLPVAHYDFVTYDDSDYVRANSVVQNGLTWAGVKWAFTTGHAGNWHPVTWLSHMTDCELFGLNPGAHHSVNVLFHVANVVLLFALLLRLTRLRADAPARQADALWPCAIITALFAWHPLHVESVAWIAERKDVLSTFFALLTLLSYTRHAQEQGARGKKTGVGNLFSFLLSPFSKSYWLALFFFALGLMSKPMLVTLPFVMLLLDYWPLQRFSLSAFRFPLLLEKIPFFALVAVSCVVTFLVQRHGAAVVTLEQFPLNLRFENAIISYGRYLLMAVWPVNLAVLYPLPNHLHWIHAWAATSAAPLVVICWLVWRARRACPYLLVGWLWYLGTLVPVIGLVQVGTAALADRYAYFPLIGIFIAIVFGVRDLAERFRFPKMILAGATILILAAYLTLTENQLRYWRNSETLFAHTLAVTQNNVNALIDYGVAFEQQGRLTNALAQYREAERLASDSVQAHYNIGNALDKLDRPAEALPEQLEAARLNPNAAFLHESAGGVLAELGRFDEALGQFAEAARLDPTYSWAHFQMGKVLLNQDRDAAAIGQFREALRLNPENYQILTYIAHVLAADENPGVRDGKTALALATKANVLTAGTQPLTLDALGMAFAETGDFTNAIEATQKAFDIATAAQMKKLEPLEQRLQLYKNHQPWRESFLATNAPAENPPKN
jgi:tetratricopeptide (TPR) repeat protein